MALVFHSRATPCSVAQGFSGKSRYRTIHRGIRRLLRMAAIVQLAITENSVRANVITKATMLASVTLAAPSKSAVLSLNALEAAYAAIGNEAKMTSETGAIHPAETRAISTR